MTVPVGALGTSPSREPAVAMSAVPLAPVQTEQARKTALLESEKKVPETAPALANAALDEINRTLKMTSIGVQFEFDKEADTMITKVVDVETGQVIRQMPSEEMVQVSKVLGKLQGLLVSQKV